jgi:hypothetical protein
MKFKVNLVVEVEVVAESADEAAGKAEETVQRVLDGHAKRLGAIVGADYGDVSEVQQGGVQSRQRFRALDLGALALIAS